MPHETLTFPVSVDAVKVSEIDFQVSKYAEKSPSTRGRNAESDWTVFHPKKTTAPRANADGIQLAVFVNPRPSGHKLPW